MTTETEIHKFKKILQEKEFDEIFEYLNKIQSTGSLAIDLKFELGQISSQNSHI